MNLSARPPSKSVSCADPEAWKRAIPGSAAFELHEAGVAFSGTWALADANLVVNPGESLALVGPSGAGKTTLLRLLNASQKPTTGSVCVDYRRLDELTPAELRGVRARIGFVHQDLALVPSLRVVSNVIAGCMGRMGFWASARAMTFPRRAHVERAAAILERVGIGEKLYQRVDSLSGGQRQRVALARALYQEPSALLLDEPVSSVDPARAKDVVELVTEISRERGITLLVSLHDIELARAFFPRLVGQRGGRIVFDRATGEIAPIDLKALYALEGLERIEPGLQA